MTKRNVLKVLIGLIGISMLMTACSGGSPTEESGPAIQPTPTLVVVGSTVDKPVPFGYDIILKNIVISINEVTRSADDLVSQTNGETPVPADNQEYLLVRITNQCIATESTTCFVGQADFQLMDSAGNTVTPISETSGADGFYSFEEFPRGTSNRGFLTFLVDKGTEYTLLAYNSFQKGRVYMALAY